MRHFQKYFCLTGTEVCNILMSLQRVKGMESIAPRARLCMQSIMSPGEEAAVTGRVRTFHDEHYCYIIFVWFVTHAQLNGCNV